MTMMQEESFVGAGGLNIHLRSWMPEAPKAILVIVHGFNSHSGQYGDVAGQYAAMGLAVFAPDLRGRGKSEGERFYVESFADYVGDVDGAVSLARSRHPGLQVFLLGHSAGGVVATMYAQEHPDIAGLICESFAFRVPAPDFAIAVLRGLAHLLPHVHVLRLKNEDFSRDPAVVAALNADPLIADEVQPTQTVAEMARADERLEQAMPAMTLPVLILHGTMDKATRPDGSQLFFDKVGSTDKTLKLYEGHYHDLLHDLGREVVLADIDGWLLPRMA